MNRDNRQAYYERVAAHIAADPLDFYTRAEKGRRYQSGEWRPIPKRVPAQVVQIRRARA